MAADISAGVRKLPNIFDGFGLGRHRRETRHVPATGALRTPLDSTQQQTTGIGVDFDQARMALLQGEIEGVEGAGRSGSASIGDAFALEPIRYRLPVAGQLHHPLDGSDDGRHVPQQVPRQEQGNIGEKTVGRERRRVRHHQIVRQQGADLVAPQ